MDQDTTTPDPNAATKSGSSAILRFVIAGMFLVVIIGVECAVAFWVFPSAEDVAALAQAQQAVKGEPLHSVTPEPDEEELLDTKQRLEISLGDFAVTAYQPLSNTTIRIDFQLYGIVLAEDGDLVMQLMDENKHRFREQVLVILRSAEMTDLTDAGLGLIKRKILEKTNRVLGRAVLQEVIFSDFSFVEQ